VSSGGGRSSSGGSSSSTTRPRWSPAGSSVAYTPAEVQALTPIRETVEKRALVPDLRDVFLCHAWDDRQGAAKDLHDLLEARGVKVWFSEKDIALGTSFLREIDRGLAKSQVGIVLVTPALLRRLQGEGSISDKELSALLHRDQLIPIVHETTYEALRDVSPLLGSRNGLSTTENSMTEVATKLAELVAPLGETSRGATLTCPKCHRQYDDDSLRFCLEDGAVLNPQYDAEAETLKIDPRGSEYR
jgi:hypothetical protein